VADKVDISELDAQDLSDILTEVKGAATKIKNAAAGRKELELLLEKKSLELTTDDEGNFVLNAKKAKVAAKGKVKAKEPEPEETEEEETEEETEEEEAEEEPAPAPAKSKVKAKPAAEETEEEEEAEPKAKRAPPPREAKYKASQKIKMTKKAAAFKEGSNRANRYEAMASSATVGEYLEKCKEGEFNNPSGFLAFCVKEGYATIT
jgi:outer membrane biosynthesis protein TonB